jgi:hypothetical protein
MARAHKDRIVASHVLDRELENSAHQPQRPEFSQISEQVGSPS